MLLTLYGLGTILGGGIYVVIGEVAGAAGILTPLAFVLAALVAPLTALSFSELTARIPDAGGPIDYPREAFGRRGLCITIGWDSPRPARFRPPPSSPPSNAMPRRSSSCPPC